MTAFFAVGIGAACGAWLRWVLGLALNPLFPTLPPGTLAANLLGGLLMGIVMALLGRYEHLSPALRLLITTGFLGGLTTFSTFSGEAVSLLLRERYAWFAAEVGAHVVGTLGATVIGFIVMRRGMLLFHLLRAA